MINRTVYEVHKFYQDLLGRVLDSNCKSRAGRSSIKKEMLYWAQVAGHNYMRQLEDADAQAAEQNKLVENPPDT